MFNDDSDGIHVFLIPLARKDAAAFAQCQALDAIMFRPAC
jgi:hypothetical protein